VRSAIFRSAARNARRPGFINCSQYRLSYSRLYDSTTNSWPSTSAGHMNNVRSGHTATLLHNGQVLIAGGFDIISNVVTYLASAELYTP
jgi:hypothetical protein